MNAKAFRYSFEGQKGMVERCRDENLRLPKETTQSEADSRPEAATKAPGGCPPSTVCSGSFLIINFINVSSLLRHVSTACIPVR